MTDPVTVLDTMIRAAGIPLVGCWRDGAGIFHYKLDQAATIEQQAQAAAILTTFSGKGRVLRPLDAIHADITALTNSQRGNLEAAARDWLIAVYIQQNPNFAVHPIFDPSINVPGDQPQ